MTDLGREKFDLVNELINDKAFHILVKYKDAKQESNGILTVIAMLDDIVTTTDSNNFEQVLDINREKDFPVTAKITIETNGDTVEIMNIVDDSTIRNMKKILNRQLYIKQEQLDFYIKDFLEEL